MKTYRERKHGGAAVAAHQKKNGDWLIQDNGVGSFRTVSDWYFTMTYTHEEDTETLDAESAALDVVDGTPRV